MMWIYRVLQKKQPSQDHTTEVMPPPSPNSMLSSEFCVWRPSKKPAISVDDARHFRSQH